MAVTIAELVTRLGFRIDAAALKSYKDSIKKSQQETIKRNATMVAAIGGAFIALSAKTFATFQAGLNELQAVSGATGAQLDKLSGQAKQLGVNTKFSAQQVLVGQIALSRAGFKTTDTLEAMAGVTSLAAATNITLADSASIAADTIGGFGLVASDMSRVADVLAITTAKSNQEISDLRESLKFVAPVGRGAGQSLEHISGLLGILANNGLKGTVAATGLNQIMSRIAKPKFRKEFENIGVSVADSAGNFRNLIDILRDVEKRTKSMTRVEASATRIRLFGQIGMKSAAAIMGTNIDKQKELFEAINKSSGASKKMADLMNRGLIPELDRTKAALENVFLEFGSRFEKPITKAMKAIQGVLKFIGNLDPVTLDVLSNLILFGTAIAGIVAGLAAFKLAWVGLGVAGITGGLTGITTVGLIAAAQFVLVGAAIALVAEDIWQFSRGNKSVTGDLIKWWNGVALEIGTEFPKALETASSFWVDFFENKATSPMNQFSDRLADWVIKTSDQLGIPLDRALIAWGNFFKTAAPVILDGFVNDVKKIADRIGKIFTDMFLSIKIPDFIRNGVAAVQNFIKDNGSKVSTSGLNTATDQVNKQRAFDTISGNAGRASQIPAGTLGVGTQNTNNNQQSNTDIKQTTIVNVGDSNTSAADIAKKSASTTVNEFRKMFGSSSRNEPLIAR